MDMAVCRSERKLRVGIILAHAFSLPAYSLFINVFRSTDYHPEHPMRGSVEWKVIASALRPVRSSCGAQVVPTATLLPPDNFDYIVVIGGSLDVTHPVDDGTMAYLRRAAEAKVTVVGVCTGSFILAEAGLLRHRRACVSWLHHSAYRHRFPDHAVEARQLFTIGRSVGTCAGGTSAGDLAAYLVKQHIGKDAERSALEILLMPRARQGNDVQPRQPLATEAAHPRLRAAMMLMEQHIYDDLTIDNVAKSVGVSRRHLERLFVNATGLSPAKVYTSVRLEKARSLVLATNASVIEIAEDVGFNTPSSFTRCFKRHFGITPSQLRACKPTGDDRVLWGENA